MTTRKTPLHHPPADEELLVEWPRVSVSTSTQDNDLGPPLAQLLVDTGLKGSQEDEKRANEAATAIKSLPVSVSIIEAGATAASKAWTAAIAGLGGATAVATAAATFWDSQAIATRGALIIAAAIVVAACALGAALIMYGDVQARGRGAAAQCQARAMVASEFLRGATRAGGPAEPGDSHPADSARAAQRRGFLHDGRRS